MSDYQKYKESHLKAQKKYDDKNREKKREYDKKRWQERKAKYQELEQLQQENQSLKKENKILRENAEHNDKVVDKVNWENQKLKKQLEEYKRLGFKHLNDKCNKLENQQKEFIKFLENEKDRLTRECSPTYKYSLGKTRLVNEDIYDEVDKILSKYKESCK